MVRACLALWLGISALAAGQSYGPSREKVPTVAREFRAAWVACVYNIDWPSRKGLSAGSQQAELRRILDKLASLKMNAIIFQVRPQADAVYKSRIEPWSPWLTGTMGRSPGYDPLAYCIQQAHARNIEVHAWFNPFRAVPHKDHAVSSDHVSRTHPSVIRNFKVHKWMDPSSSFTRDRAINVIMDVVRRYDVDGIHIDDYFYPYPDTKHTAFPDDASWKKYSGNMARNDWRRMHINNFIRQINTEIHRVKPWVKFGVSPFGIWRPGHPKQIKGLDAYDELYADARLWLREGWLDYCAPQLYWQIADTEQAFPVLMQWWHEQNPKRRHLWPGINTAKVKP